MKKMSKMGMIIIAIVVLIVGVTVTVFSINKKIEQKRKQAIQAVMEKYSEYKYLSEIAETEKYEIMGFDDKFSGVSPNPPYFDKTNNVIFVVCNNDVDETNFTKTYYRLNRYGAITDTFLVDGYVEYEGYFISKDNYVTWLIDGDKTKKAYKSINQQRGYDPQSLKKIFAEYYDSSTIVQFYDDHYESPVTDKDYIEEHSDELFFDGTDDTWYKTQMYRAIFFRDGQWHSLDSEALYK